MVTNSSKEAGRATTDDRRIRSAEMQGDATSDGAIAGRAVGDLMAEVQSLLGQLAHVADPEISRLREKVANALTQAQRVVADGTAQVQRRARLVVRTGDTYVRDRPWQSVGVAAAVGVVVGFMVARR
jgi:ElaB/YqjD/DUF883 family membrane-anchored ribosome-binding protein